MVTSKKKIWILLCASLALTACSKARVSQGSIPEQGLTVSQIYRQSMAQNTTEPARSGSLYQGKRFEQRVTFEDSGEEFKPLPNPEVPIHVFAHVANLGDEQIIKPGYTTRFFLYKQNQYALASEMY